MKGKAKQMKIAITTSGDTLQATVDSRFGRAQKFCVIDPDSGEFQIIDNRQNLQAMQGAGIQAAQQIIDSGATCLITGNCGPKAFFALNAAGIKIYSSGQTTVSEAIDAFKANTLQQVKSANVEGHWA